MERKGGGSGSPDAIRSGRTKDKERMASAGPMRQVLREGTMAGICGYFAVLVVVTALDLLSGRSAFHTAAQLGAWLFHPVEDALTGPGWPSALAYNGLHLILSLFVGTVAATMVALSERVMGFWYVALMLLIAAGIYTVGALGAIAVEFKGLTDWSTAILGTAAWVVGITVYLRFAHPRLVAQMKEESADRGG
jgi:hypothetical protein